MLECYEFTPLRDLSHPPLSADANQRVEEAPKTSLLADVGDLTELMLNSARARATEKVESQKSRESLVAQFMALDPLVNELFEERAAILEHDEGLPREEAERLAAKRVLEQFHAD